VNRTLTEVMLDPIVGRRAFGADALNYDSARPEYPARVFALLQERCGLGPGTQALEIGPGTGLATRPMLDLGATITAVEPDERLAAVLRHRSAGTALEVVAAPFEDAVLPEASFDLGYSATAFHWLEQRPALVKVASVLRPGGSWAMWWNVFGDAERADPFHDATTELLSGLSLTPSQPVNWRHPFALDREARFADLRAGGDFDDIEFENLRWTLVLDPSQLRALYATFSHITTLPEVQRERLLDALQEIAAGPFAGRVERNMCTAIYTAKRVG